MRKAFKKSVDFLFDKSVIASGISLILLSIIDISNLDEKTIKAFGAEKFELGKIFYYFIVLSSLLFGVISVVNGKEIGEIENELNSKSNRINELESKLNEIVNESNELFNSYLRLLLKNLGFTHLERVSVYKAYSNKFKLIARYSIDPILMEAGRSEYPIGEGFIGKGWREGEFFVDNLPDPNINSGDLYYRAISQLNDIPREVSDRIRMKSRNFFVYRIDGYNERPSAVLVFESLNPCGFNKSSIIEKLSGVAQPLVMFVESNNGVLITENLMGI